MHKTFHLKMLFSIQTFCVYYCWEGDIKRRLKVVFLGYSRPSTFWILPGILIVAFSFASRPHESTNLLLATTQFLRLNFCVLLPLSK